MKDIKTFKSDGCSLFPDSAAWGEEWTPCCYAHDFAYWQGGTKHCRLEADKALRKCVKDRGHPIIAFFMYHAVRIFGSRFFPLGPCTWGYGHEDKRQYYEELSKSDKVDILSAIRGFKNDQV